MSMLNSTMNNQEKQSKIRLCSRCEVPMKRLISGIEEQVFYICSPCESVRQPLRDEEADVAITARERDPFGPGCYPSFSF